MTNHRVTSILLCALLSSTLGHEYLRVKRFAPESRKSIIQSPFQERTSDLQECSIVCNNQTDQGLRLYVNVTTSLVAIVNLTANAALIIDLNYNLVGLFNGNSGTIIIINIETNSGVYITASNTNKVWLKANQSFDVYFQSLISLKYFVDLHVGTSFQIDTVSTEIATIVGQLLILFSAQFQYQIQGNIKASLSIFLKIGVSLTTLLKGSLNGFLQFAGAGAIVLHGDIVWFVAVFQGFGAFFAQISGGLTALITAGVRFNLSLLLGASTGIEVFINLLLAISERIDLTILAGILNSTEAFFVLIAQLGGNVSYGTNGIFKVIANIIELINGHIQIDVLLQTLIEFSASQRGSVDLQVYWQGLIKIVQITSANSSSSLSGFYSIVTNLQQGTLIVRGVNISEILVILSQHVQTSIVLTITILFRISVIVQIVISIPLLFFRLILYLNSYYGIYLLNNLGFSITISGSGSIIGQILAGFNIATITQFIISGFKLTDVLPRLPVIGTIYISFQNAVKVVSNGSTTFSSLLSSSGSTSAGITAYLKGILNLGPKPTEPTTTPTFGDGGFESIWKIVGGGSISGGTGTTVSGGAGGVTVNSGGGSGGSVTGSGGGGGSIGGSWGWSIGSGGGVGGGASGSEGGSVTYSADGGSLGPEGGTVTFSADSGSSGSIGGGGSGSAGGSWGWSIGSGGESGGGSVSGSEGGNGTGSASGGSSGSVDTGGSGSAGSGSSGSVGTGGSGSAGSGSSGSVGTGGSGSAGSGSSGSVGTGGSGSAGSGSSGSVATGGSGSAGSGGSGSVGGGSSVGGSWGWGVGVGGDSGGGANGSASDGGSVSGGGDDSGSVGGGGSGSASGGASWGWGGGVASGGNAGGSADEGSSVDGGSQESANWSVKHKSGHHKQPEKERKQQKSEHQN